MTDNTKIRIFPGDTLPIAYECRRPDVANYRNTIGLPDQPVSATVRILNKQTGEFIDIDGVGVTVAPCTITPKTGTESTDTGAIVRYTVEADLTQTPGDYTLLMTAVFADGAILTEDKRYKVNEFR